MKGFLLLTSILILPVFLSLSGCSFAVSGDKPEEEEEKIDDWIFSASALSGINPTIATGSGSLTRMVPNASPMMMKGMSASRSIGFSVGGAKDSDNFSENLDRGYLPKFSSITYEGVFYDHYFDTGAEKKCESLFCPTYTRAVTKDLYSGDTDYYLNIGLNSGLTEESFQRKKLNLVVVLDISGSMGASFDRYYYDGPKDEEENDKRSKMEIANNSIVAMMKHLLPEDRFGVALFDDLAYKAKPLRLVRNTDMEAISTHILELKERGGTNWQAGYKEGVKLFDSLEGKIKDRKEFENRIIFLTDAMPNVGELEQGGLFAMVKDAAENDIYTSFIGIGVDFNNDLVEAVTKTRGANYFSVHSSKEFSKRMDKEFDFMVTPLLFDLKLTVKSDDFSIGDVFGSPEADRATGEMMEVATLFPSATEDEQIKGGVVLLKLRKKSTVKAGTVKLELTYQDRSGKSYSLSDLAEFTEENLFYDNPGIRKAILLSTYVSLVKNWIIDARKDCHDKVERPVPYVFPFPQYGIKPPGSRPEFKSLETWERKSCELDVSDGYRKFFQFFTRFYRSEMDELNDPSLTKELKILERLITNDSGKVPGADKKRDDWQGQR
jgi:Ca-activated chloride channel homolog